MFGASAVHGVDQRHHARRPLTARHSRLGSKAARIPSSASLRDSHRIRRRDARLRRLWRRHARAGLARRLGRRRSQAQPARRYATWAAASCGCAPRARCSTRKPRASSRATTATATKTSRAPTRIPKRFRDASSARVVGALSRDRTCSATSSRFELAGIYRRSRMDFLQHFLIGKPLEHNAQTSYMLSGTRRLRRSARSPRALALDAETGGLRAHRVPAGPRHRRHAARQRHPPGRLSLRLHGRLLDAGRHARARIPHRRPI